jgi:protoporphyrinogen IX oxidase
MLWVKAFHIVFIASWFAGLFYLPRIFVNLAMVPPESVAERQRLLLMARKLMRFTTLLAVPALALGSGCGSGWATASVWAAGNGWMHAKLLVVLLILVTTMPAAHAARSSAARTGATTSGTAGSTKRPSS